ncbi:MAG: endonuclease/exonuclease/phosphatase family protein [Bacteroidota bacterium]
MKIFGRVLLGILALPVLFLLYVGICVGHGTFTDFQPQEEITLDIQNSVAANAIADSTLSFLIWNVGYGGLGAKSDFFFDDQRMLLAGDKMVRSPKALVEDYLQQQEQFLAGQVADFYLLQEVDVASKRSHYTNELTRFAKLFPTYEYTFAPNYKVQRVPLPVLEPFNVMGKMLAGLGTYSRYAATEAKRLQLPGEFAWPDRIFQLDRCLGLHRYNLQNGKELVVLNVHNSAYDKGGKMKVQQMDYFKKLVLEEYAKGNYVVAGGDWNQCPPDFPFDKFMPGRSGRFTQTNIAADFLPADWTWAYDASTPSNRKLPTKYKAGESFVTTIDFYVVSPNVEVQSIQTTDLQFQASDHQPIYLRVKLK